MIAVFAGIPWRCNINDATELLIDGGLRFSLLEPPPSDVIASAMAELLIDGGLRTSLLDKKLFTIGNFLGRRPSIFLSFDTSGLYEVKFLFEVNATSSRGEYESIKDCICEKHGLPTSSKKDWSLWLDDEITGSKAIFIMISENHEDLSVTYKTQELSEKQKSEMPIIFAGIPWHSSIEYATNLLEDKSFTVSQKDSNSLVARGTIFGKISSVSLTFENSGLYTVDIMVNTEVKNVWEDYNLIKDLLVEKYGPPTDDDTGIGAELGWLQWEQDENSGNGEVAIILSDEKEEIFIYYKSLKASQADKNEMKEKRKNLNESRSVAMDLL